MPVMQVRPVRVRVADRLVLVAMGMAQHRGLAGMRVEVMIIVVAMLVLKGFVPMAVSVPVLGEQADQAFVSRKR